MQIHHEMKMGKGTMEIISCTKIRACSLKNIAPKHSLSIVLFFGSQINLVFKFNLVLIE